MINEFISLVKSRGLARSNRFAINIPFPYADNDQQNIVRLFCDAVQLPGMQVETAPQRIWGEIRNMPYDRSFDMVNFSFYLDTNMEAKRLFDQWLSLIQNPQTRTLNYYKNYIQTVTIDVLDVESETTIYQVTLHEAYPRVVTPIQMDASSKDVMKLNVTMAFKHYTTTATEDIYKPSPIIERTQDPMSTNIGDGYSTAVSDTDFIVSPLLVSAIPKPIISNLLTRQSKKD